MPYMGRRPKTKRGRSKKHYPRRCRHQINYHGRSGRPVVHMADSGRKYIMVRAPGGEGTKRLYEGSLYVEKKKEGTKKRLFVGNC